jgi:hypothetical protein
MRPSGSGLTPKTFLQRHYGCKAFLELVRELTTFCLTTSADFPEHKGKTLLSSAVIAETQKIGKVIYAFLSYKFASSLSALAILHSLIFQLAADRDDLQEIVCQSSSEALTSSIEAATELLKTLVHCATPVYIVIDGLDEIDEMERGRLLKHISSLVKTDDGSSSARVCISSRIETDLLRIFQDWAVIRVDHHNAGSIQKFVNQRARQWYCEDNISSEVQSEIDGLLAPLASHAKGKTSCALTE